MNPEGTVYNAQGRINRLSVLCIDAYGVAVKNGFNGTVEEWLASLRGEKGDPGYVNYDFAEMGLPNVVINGDMQRIEMDTSELSANFLTSYSVINLNLEYRGLVFRNVKATFFPNCNVATINVIGTLLYVSMFIGNGSVSVRADLFNALPGVPSVIIDEITLLASKWEGSGNLYSQVVDVMSATKNSQVDLTPSVEQLVVFYEKDISFVTENEDGVITVYVIGQKPTNDYTIQVTITEVMA